MGLFSNYCGLGGSGPVQHEVDQICKKHDELYDKIAKSKNPYLYYNLADNKFLQDLEKLRAKGVSENIIKYVATGYFKAKRIVAPHAETKIDIIKQTNIPINKRPISEIAVDAKGEFITPQKVQKVMPKITPEKKPRGAPYNTNLRGPVEELASYEDVEMEGAQIQKSSSNATGWATHGETPVENIPVTRYSPFDKTTQVLMPYFNHKKNLTLETGFGPGSMHARAFRLNSIYDTETITTYTPDPNRAPDQKDGVINTPCMRNYWNQFYRKWTVVGSRYRVRFRSNDRISTDSQYSIYIYEHGQQAIPLVDGNNHVIPDLYRRYHPHIVKHMYYNSRDKHETINQSATIPNDTIYQIYNKQNDWVTIHSGTYNKNSIEHSVVEDEQQKTWHDFDQVPPEREVATVIIQRSDTSDTNPELHFELEFSIEYIVQLKDLYAQYEYFTPTTDLSVNTNFAAQSN